MAKRKTYKRLVADMAEGWISLSIERSGRFDRDTEIGTIVASVFDLDDAVLVTEALSAAPKNVERILRNSVVR